MIQSSYYPDETPKPGAILTTDILPERPLSIFEFDFQCPYCGREQMRGGGREGFVKSGMMNHTATCYNVVLYLAGFVHGPYVIRKPGKWIKRDSYEEEVGSEAGNLLVLAESVDPRRLANLKAAVGVRRRAGVLNRLRAQADETRLIAEARGIVARKGKERARRGFLGLPRRQDEAIRGESS